MFSKTETPEEIISALLIKYRYETKQRDAFEKSGDTYRALNNRNLSKYIEPSALESTVELALTRYISEWGKAKDFLNSKNLLPAEKLQLDTAAKDLEKKLDERNLAEKKAT